MARFIRATQPNALFIALTGTPLINQIEDFRMIWQFLGWIDEKKPLPELMMRLKDDHQPVFCYQEPCLWLDIGRQDDYAAALDLFETRKDEFFGGTP